MFAYSDYNDIELVKLMKADDRVAFTELYDRYWLKLLEVAFRLVNDEATAEDTVQDVFINIWKGRHKLNIQSLENYLFISVKYRSLYYLRKGSQVKLYENGSIPEISSDNSEIVNQKYLAEWLERETCQLPVKCQLIFRYSREQDMTAKQIADKLSISVRTVETQLYKAKLRLKRSSKTLSLLLSLFF